MGLAIKLRSRVYFDANIFIYAIEDHEAYRSHISLLYTHLVKQKCQVVTGELTYAECMVKPVKENKIKSIAIYENILIHSNNVALIPVSLNVLRHAAMIRANQPTKLPDAIHGATALETDCSYIVSNDRKLPVLEGIENIYLSDLADNLE